MGVCGFGEQVGVDGDFLVLNRNIKEVGLIMGKFGSEFDGPVEGIHVVNECVETSSLVQTKKISSM